MKISYLFIIIIFSGCSFATDDSENCSASKELNDICGEHTFQSVKPILIYVDQLQNELLSNNCETKQKEIDDMREKLQELQLELAKGKLKDDVIISKDAHIKDLQATNSILKQLLESANNEIVQLKTLIKDPEHFKIDSNDAKLEHCENELKNINKTIDYNYFQLKSKEESLKSCQLSLEEAQSVVREYKLQLENKNKIITDNATTISQLETKVKSKNETLIESKKKLIENENDLRKHEKGIYQKEQEVIEKTPTSCTTYGYSNKVHNIKTSQSETFSVLCNSKIAGPGWIVIQQRLNGKENFNRNWEAYKNGFGNFTGNFFLGLEKIHRLTNDQPHELYILMERLFGTFYVRYDNIKIAGEDDKYRLLSLGLYSGNADKDRMRYNEYQTFSTFDKDNDEYKQNCAELHGAGWWYGGKDCTECNLNGQYYQALWTPSYRIKTIKMLIRPRR